MPTYGYRCQQCSTEFDVMQRMSDPAEASCPSCGGPGKRLFFPAGIVFKGSGFYKTDSRSATSASSNGSGDAAAPKSAPAPAAAKEGAADTAKPAAPAPAKDSSGSAGVAAPKPPATPST